MLFIRRYVEQSLKIVFLGFLFNPDSVCFQAMLTHTHAIHLHNAQFTVTKITNTELMEWICQCQ